jgi:PIN domain nuclease of toxin-antitoxin system
VSSLLLDTCALLWVANGDQIDADARTATAAGALHVSAISAWEIASLARKGRIALTMPVAAWFRQAVERMRAEFMPVTLDIFVDSCTLPGTLGGDPADRIIIATARANALTIVTRDAAILRYAKHGHVQALYC